MYHVRFAKQFVVDFEFAITANMMFVRFASLDVSVDLTDDETVLRRHEGGNFHMIVAEDRIQLTKGSAVKIYSDHTALEIVNAIKPGATIVVSTLNYVPLKDGAHNLIWPKIDLSNGYFAGITP